MSLATISEALAQYNDNLDWDTDATKARLALSALRFLKVNRAQALSGAGSGLTFEAIDAEIESISAFLSVAEPTKQRTSFTSARSRWA